MRSEWLPALGKAKSTDIDSEFDVASNSLSCEMVDGIIAFSKFSELKKLILITMAYEMDKQSVKEIRDIFLSLDKNGQGTLNKQEFRIAMENRIDDDEIDILFQSIDHDKSGQIHWNEWLAALLDCHGLVTTENLVETFDRLDSDGKQYITKTDIKLLLGTDFDEKLVDKMISNLDISGEGKVSCFEIAYACFGIILTFHLFRLTAKDLWTLCFNDIWRIRFYGGFYHNTKMSYKQHCIDIKRLIWYMFGLFVDKYYYRHQNTSSGQY